jgi:hypothetical protein
MLDFEALRTSRSKLKVKVVTAIGTLRAGVDVMITIFYDFCQFSAKKMAFFSNNNVKINILQKLAVV